MISVDGIGTLVYSGDHKLKCYSNMSPYGGKPKYGHILWWWARCWCSSSLYAQHAPLLLVAARWPGVKFPASSTPVVRPWQRASPRNTEHKLLSHRTQGTGLYAIIYRIKQRYLTNPPHMYEYVKYVWQFSKSLFRTSLKLYDVVGLNFVACHFHNNLKLEWAWLLLSATQPSTDQGLDC